MAERKVVVRIDTQVGKEGAAQLRDQAAATKEITAAERERRQQLDQTKTALEGMTQQQRQRVQEARGAPAQTAVPPAAQPAVEVEHARQTYRLAQEARPEVETSGRAQEAAQRQAALSREEFRDLARQLGSPEAARMFMQQIERQQQQPQPRQTAPAAQQPVPIQLPEHQPQAQIEARQPTAQPVKKAGPVETYALAPETIRPVPETTGTAVLPTKPRPETYALATAPPVEEPAYKPGPERRPAETYEVSKRERAPVKPELEVAHLPAETYQTQEEVKRQKEAKEAIDQAAEAEKKYQEQVKAAREEVTRLVEAEKQRGQPSKRDWIKEVEKAPLERVEAVREHLAGRETQAGKEAKQKTREDLGIDQIEKAEAAERKYQEQIKKSREEVERLIDTQKRREEASGRAAAIGPMQGARSAAQWQRELGKAGQDQEHLEAVRRMMERQGHASREAAVAQHTRQLGGAQPGLLAQLGGMLAGRLGITGLAGIGGPGGPGSPGGPGGGGGMGAGAMGGALAASIPAAAALAALAASLKTTEAGMRQLTEVNNILGNASLTAAQKSRALAESLPLVGGWFESLHKLADSLTGTTEKMRANAASLQIDLVKISAAATAEQKTRAGRTEVEETGRRATALAHFTPAPFRTFDRSTFQGEIARQEYMSVLPAKDTRDQMAVEVEMAKKNAEAARQRRDDLGKRAAAAAAEQERAAAEAQRVRRKQGLPEPGQQPRQESATREIIRRGLGYVQMAGEGTVGYFGRQTVTSRQKGNIDTAATEAKRAEAQAAALQKAHEEAILEAKQKGIEADRKSSELRKANVEIAKAELAVLEAKEQRLASQSTRIGGMNKADRMIGLQAATYIKEQGIQAATPQMIQAAEQFAPDYIRKIKEAFGRTTEEYQAGVERGLLEEGVLEEVRKQVDRKVQANVRMELVIDTKQLAIDIAATVQETFRELIKNIKLEQDRQTTAAAVQQMQGFNAQK
jgi:hypothetical protein